MQTLVLQDKNARTIAQKVLETPADYRRVQEANILQYQGQYYGFVGIREGLCIFEERAMPVIVDGFVNKL